MSNARKFSEELRSTSSNLMSPRGRVEWVRFGCRSLFQQNLPRRFTVMGGAGFFRSLPIFLVGRTGIQNKLLTTEVSSKCRRRLTTLCLGVFLPGKRILKIFSFPPSLFKVSRAATPAQCQLREHGMGRVHLPSLLAEPAGRSRKAISGRKARHRLYK